MTYQNPLNYVDLNFLININDNNPNQQMAQYADQYNSIPYAQYLYEYNRFSAQTQIPVFMQECNSIAAPAIYQNQYLLKRKSQNQSYRIKRRKNNKNFY